MALQLDHLQQELVIILLARVALIHVEYDKRYQCIHKIYCVVVKEEADDTKERMEGMEGRKVTRLMFIDWSLRNSHSYNIIHVLSQQRTLSFIKKTLSDMPSFPYFSLSTGPLVERWVQPCWVKRRLLNQPRHWLHPLLPTQHQQPSIHWDLLLQYQSHLRRTLLSALEEAQLQVDSWLAQEDKLALSEDETLRTPLIGASTVK
jgi:hypothetical protein